MWQLRSINTINCREFIILKATEDLNKAIKLARSLGETENYICYITKVDKDNTVKYLNELLEYSI